MNTMLFENLDKMGQREAVLSSLEKFAEALDVNFLKSIQYEGATEADRCAAEAILWCVDVVNRHGGLNLSSAIQRVYAYSSVSDPVCEIYEIAQTPDPEQPAFPTKTEDVYGCRAILYAMDLAGATL
jgi:hypothetical protein